MSGPSKSNYSRIILKVSGIILGVIVAIILVFTILLFTVLEPYAERYIKSQVSEHSDGLYTVEFDDIDLNLITRTATFQNVHLIPDTAVHQKQTKTGTKSSKLYELEVPTLKIAGIGIVDALFRNKISVKTLILDKPQIVWLTDENGEKDEVGKRASTGELYEILNSVEIGELQISGGSFKQKKPGASILLHEIPHVSVLIDGLWLGFSDQNDPKIDFHAEDIQVKVKNYTYRSPDSLYNIEFSFLNYSSLKAELLVDSIMIMSNELKDENLKAENANRYSYDISIPQVRISGFDILKPFQTQNLFLGDVFLINPLVNVLENQGRSVWDENEDIKDIYRDLSENIKVVEARSINIQEGSLHFQKKHEEIVSDIHQLEKIDLALQDLRIDSGTVFNPGGDLLISNAEASVGNYLFNHPDSPYTVKAAGIGLSTLNHLIKADSIRVIGDWQENQFLIPKNQAMDILFNVDISQINIRKVDLIKSLKTSKLVIGDVTVEQSNVNLLIDRNINPNVDRIDLKEIFQDVSGFITEIDINEIKINDASFSQHLRKKNRNIRQVQQLEHASVLFSGFFIDSTFIYQQEKKLPFENINLIAHKYTYFTPDNIHSFALDRLHFASKEQELRARTIHIEYDRDANNKLKTSGDAHRNLYNVFASKFKILGLDLIGAVNTGRLSVNQIMLHNPELNIFLDRNIPPSPAEQDEEGILDDFLSLFNPIAVNSLQMSGGSFTIHEKLDKITRTHLLEQASANVMDLYLTSDKVSDVEDALPFEDVILIAKDYTYRSHDNIYSIRMDSMLYSSRAQVLSANFIDVKSNKEENNLIKLKNLKKANRNLFDISAAKFRISGFDLLYAYETGFFVMEEVLLENPELVVLQDQNVPEKMKPESEGTNEVVDQVAEVIETFTVERLLIRNGALQMYTLKDSVQREQRVEHVFVTVDRLRLASLEANDPLEMFDVADVRVLVQDFNYILPDSLYVLQVGAVESSLKDQSLTIEDLRLVPLFKIEEYPDRLEFVEDRFDILVSEIHLLEIDLLALFNNQDIILEKAIIQNAMVDVYRDERLERDPDRRPVTLQNMLHRADQNVQANAIIFEDAELSFSSVPIHGGEPVILILDSIFIELTNVTNNHLLLRDDPIANAKAYAKLMGESELELTFQFDLDHPEDLYSFQGALESMKFKALNPLIENLLPIRLEDGLINSVSFSVEASEHIAKGNMNFFYNDLEVKLVNKDDPGSPGFWLRAGTWLVNNFMIKSHNPTHRGRFREGNIEVERDYEKSVFNHMGEALIDGIGSSIMTPFVEKVVDIFVGEEI